MAWICIERKSIASISAQGVPNNRASFHIALVYFYLFAKLNETFYTLTINTVIFSLP